jgi:futalosine hydrolase
MMGIIAATKTEADDIIRELSPGEPEVVQSKHFYRGVLFDRIPAVLSVCGIGKTNAAHAATLLIERFRPRQVFVIGVAGAYPRSSVALGDVLIASQEIYGDEGLALADRFCAMHALGLPLYVRGDAEHYNAFPLSIPEPFSDFRNGAFVTVSSCTGTLSRGWEIERQFGAVCENMEGAAVAHVCALNDIPVSEIRAISNIITDRTSEGLPKDDIIHAARAAQKAFLDRLRTTHR